MYDSLLENLSIKFQNGFVTIQGVLCRTQSASLMTHTRSSFGTNANFQDKSICALLKIGHRQFDIYISMLQLTRKQWLISATRNFCTSNCQISASTFICSIYEYYYYNIREYYYSCPLGISTTRNQENTVLENISHTANHT